MAIKKYSSGRWSPTTYRKYGTETDTITSLPAQIIGDGQAITSCQISGNTVQDGTPTPSDPVNVGGVGEKTMNLADEKIQNALVSANGIIEENTFYDLMIIPVIAGSQYTFYYRHDYSQNYVVAYYVEKPIIGSVSYNSSRTVYYYSDAPQVTITVPSGVTYIAIRLPKNGELMLNSGGVALPYEPYGYKLDISSGGRNLFDGELEKGVWDSVSTLVQTTSEVFCSFKRNLPAGTYTLSFPNSVNIVRLIADGTLTQNLATNVNSYTVTTTTDGDIGFSFRLTTSFTTPWDNENVMLNTGSTALPYEPYNRIATPIYLGQVLTTRRIRKLVLDGTETWTYRGGEPPNLYYLTFAGAHFINNYGLCTHYPNQDSGRFDDLADKHVMILFAKDGTKSYIGLRDSSITSTGSAGVSELKEYLAAQYAAGTPVTIWYVLATPVTRIVNEPLMKIGDYTDTVAAANIPTTGTPENFDVGTTLKPSEVQLTYHGWHEHTDTKYTQGE